MMHGDEGIGVDGLKKLDPGPIPMILSMLMTSWNMVQVPFTMNLYLHCLDIRPFLLSNSRQPTATLMVMPTISANHLEAELDCTFHTN
jgi:hypothetical protein